MMKAILFAVLAAPASAALNKYCQSDGDCKTGTYCMNDPTQTPTPIYLCQGTAAANHCRSDADCVVPDGSYCMDDDSNTPVGAFYLCNESEEKGEDVAITKPALRADLKTQTCETNDDCQSFCDNDHNKKPPYTCRAVSGRSETSACATCDHQWRRAARCW